jgi:hypothetical protein
MSLFSWFKKPDWQSRDVEKRVHAVASDRDPSLVAVLPQLLRQDPEPRVRRAAVERIDDLTALADRMSNDADAGVRERARERLIERMQKGAPLDERLRALKLLDDTALLEGIARKAPERELRVAALERIKRPGFIAERCLEDPDFAVRLQLIERIDGVGALERLAEQARTKDKRLFRAIRERIEAAKIAAGDAPALLAQAEALCVALEAQLREPSAASEAILTKAEGDWLALRKSLRDERFDKRFEGARQTLRASLDAIARKARGEEPDPAAIDVVEPIPVLVSPRSERAEPDPSLQELLAEAEGLPLSQSPAWIQRWEAAWSSERDRPAVDQPLRVAAQGRMQAWREQTAATAARNEAARGAFAGALGALRKAIEDGQLAQARSAREEAHRALADLAESESRSARHKLADAERGIDKLLHWQRWSDNKVRMRLCDDVEALIGSGLHPDALASRIAELKQQWQALEHDPADKESGLAKRFRFLCFKAMEPAKGFFEKRNEVRGKRGEELGEFLERVAPMVDSAAAKSLIEIKREAQDRLRRVDEVDPKQRAERGRQLKQLIERIGARIDQDFQHIAEEKQKLINQLKRQLAHAELDAALDLCKSAQRKWKEIGNGSRKTDQAQWEEFRAEIDPWFAKQNDTMAAASAAQQAEIDAASALIEQLQAALLEPLDAAHLQARIDKIDSDWRASDRPRQLESKFERAMDAAQAAVANRNQEQASAELRRCAELALVLDGIESGNDAIPDFVANALATLPSAAAAGMRARVARIADASDALRAEQLELGRALVLEAEYLAGIESPDSEREARLALQVRLLAERMSSRGDVAASEARDQLRIRWWSLGPLPAAERARLAARFANAIGD